MGRWRHALDGMLMRARRVILDRLEWNRIWAVEVHRIALSDAIQMCLRRRHPLSPLTPTFISGLGAGQGARGLSVSA